MFLPEHFRFLAKSRRTWFLIGKRSRWNDSSIGHDIFISCKIKFMKPRWAVLLILQILFPVLCLACTCALPTFEQQMKAATAVFTGKVLTTRHNGEQLEVKLQMIRTWKGPSGATILVETAENSAACGYSFEPDRVYLVYA